MSFKSRIPTMGLMTLLALVMALGNLAPGMFAGTALAQPGTSGIKFQSLVTYPPFYYYIYF